MLSWVKNKQLISRILIIKLILAFSVVTFFPLEVDAAGRVRVRGYYRKDGTYVKPHYRSAPDGNPYNNYSYPGNYNPNTGRITPGNPQTYLNRYYNKSSSSYSSPSVDFDQHLKDLEKQIQADLDQYRRNLEKRTQDFDKWLKDFDRKYQISGDVNVQGYFRSDGTYVKPHTRTAPDGNPFNNYSYPGNYNPNTGSITPGNFQTYLDRYDRGSNNTGPTKADINRLIKELRNQSTAVPKVNPYKITSSRPSSMSQTQRGGTFTVGSTKGEVVAIQGQPSSFTDTQFNYGSSRVYFWNGRVTRWTNHYPNTLKGMLEAAYTTKTHFTVGSTKGEVVAIQGQPSSFTDTQFNYGSSRVYFWNDRVTRWTNHYPNTLKGMLEAAYTTKTHFTVGSTKGEVVAIQGQPSSFTDTQFNYGSSRVYFWNDRVTRWTNHYPNTLKGMLEAAYTTKTHFTVGSTKGEVVAIQGQPSSFTDTQFNYGSSRVYFWNDRVTRWTNHYPNTLKAR